MASTPSASRGRSWWRRGPLWFRGLCVLVLLALSGLGCALVLPIPLGWIARPIVAGLDLGPTGPTLSLEDATFRWQFGRPVLTLEVAGVRASVRGQPLANVPLVTVAVAKQGLLSGRAVATEVTIRDPALTLDQTGTGALAVLTSTAPAPASAAASPAPAAAPLDLKAYASYLPAAGQAMKLSVSGLSVRWKSPEGETGLKFAPIEATLSGESNGDLTFVAAVPLTDAAVPPRVELRGTVVPATGRVRYSAGMSAFALAGLPHVPGLPNPLPLQANVSWDVAGNLDLASGTLEDVAGGVVLRDASLVLPDAGRSPIPISAAEFRGRADLKAGTATLETGRFEMAGMQAVVSRLDATLGEQMRIRWNASLTGLRVHEVLGFLPPALRAQLPFPESALATLRVDRAATAGDLRLAQDAAKAWFAQSVEADGRVELALGTAPLAVTWQARQADPAAAVSLQLSVPDFDPAPWAAALLPGSPAQAVRLPLALAVEASVTPAGVPQSARVALTGGAGSIEPLMSGLPAVAVRRFEVRLESDSPERSWRVPVARLELANDARAELVETGVELGSDLLSIRGEARATGLAGEFLAAWLSPADWQPLTDIGVAPADLALPRAGVRFAAQAKAERGTWKPHAATVDADVELRLRGAPLGIVARALLPEGGKEVQASVEVGEFRPSVFRLALAEGIDSSAFDFPVTVRATARANLEGVLTAAAAQVRAGPGRLRLPEPTAAEVPVRSFSLDAAYEPAQERVRIDTLMGEVGPLRFQVREATAGLAAPHAVAAKLELAGFPVSEALALWPATLEPATRRQVLDAWRGGEFGGLRADLAASYDPAAKDPAQALRIIRLTGDASVDRISAVVPEVPGPVSLRALAATFNYPQARLELRDLAAPGVAVPSVQIDVSGLDRPETASAVVSGRFESDLLAANLAWKMVPEGMVRGRAAGEFGAEAALSGKSGRARVSLDTRNLQLQLPAGVPALPATLGAEVSLGAASGIGATQAAFALETSEWLGAPVKLSGTAALDAAYTPERIELTAYEHGRTRVQGRVTLTGGVPAEVALTGSLLDLEPLLRMGVMVADAMAPASSTTAAVPGAPAVSSVPRPAPVAAQGTVASMALDVRLDRIDFGSGQTARDLRVQARMENNFPAAVAVQVTANDGNGLKLDLSGPANRQKLNLVIDDAAGWMRTVTGPWHAAAPGAGSLGTLVAQLVKVPSLVSGGRVTVEAEHLPNEAEWLRGSFRLAGATMVRPPRILQLLALKSGKSLQGTPLLQEFSVGKFSLGPQLASAEAISLTGSGLINNLKMTSATYALTNEAVKVDGEYFGVGFEVVGTRAAPQVFLKDDNRLLRTIGTRNEFDFFGPPAAPAPAAR